MRLLVTGGAGYIGGFTTRLLRRCGHRVTVLDDLSSGHRAAAGKADLVVGDFCDEAAVRQVLSERRIEAVLHFAGLKSVAESWQQPDRYHRVNVEGTRSLLRAMASAGVGVLVYSGTCAVYGAPSRLPVDEGQPTSPLNPYGKSKMLAEEAIGDASADWGLRHCILRYFNAGGAEVDGSAGESLDGAANLLPSVMRVALGRASYVPIFGMDYDTPDGTAVRDYIHVLDLAEAHLRALDYLLRGGESVAVNVGTGLGTSVREVLAAAERVVCRPIPTKDRGRREGDPPAIWADPSRAAWLLNWRASYGIDEIVETAWHWHSRRQRAAG